MAARRERLVRLVDVFPRRGHVEEDGVGVALLEALVERAHVELYAVRDAPLLGVLFGERGEFLAAVVGADLAGVADEVREGAAEAARARAAFDDGAAREDVQVLDDEARFLRENYLRLAFYAARELAERRAQEIVDLPLRRADALAVIMFHNFGMLYLSEVRPL